MARVMFRMMAVLLALFGLVALVTTVQAERPSGRDAAPASQGNTPGYTLHYTFTSDPNKLDFVASFTPDVKAIYAWATVSADNGAAEKQFTVDIQFLAPDGTTAESQWYGSDTGTVTSYPAEAKSFEPKNVARKQVSIAGTPNVQRTGQWTVNFSIGEKLISSGNFTLADATNLGQTDIGANAKQALVDAGYTVIEFTDAKSKDGSIFAYTIMAPASKDLYSSETTQQIVDGLAALRQAFPPATKLYVFLSYDPRYEVAYYTDAASVDAYLQTNDFKTFWGKISVDVFDNQEGKYLGRSGSKNFISKNFGAGNYQAPLNPPLGKKSTSAIGSVRVQASPSSLPADGASKAIVTVTVIDNRNKPLADVEVEFALSGSATGTIRPRITSTDANGQADAVLTAGAKNGAVTITAKVRDTTGTAVVTIGQGSDDPGGDNAIAFLSAQGYKATKAGYLGNDKKAAAVLIDLGQSYQINEVVLPIIYGMTALRKYFSEATQLAVIIPYQQNFLFFVSTAQQYDDLGKALGAAKSDEDKRKAFTDYLNVVFGQAALVDKNGNRVSTFKDFYNKNFTGG